MSDLPEKDSREQLLTREQLAERWQCSTKTIDRLRALDKNNSRHLKSTELTKGLIRFRLNDVIAYERRFTHNSLLLLSKLSQDDQVSEWIRLARLAGFLEEDEP